MKFYALIFLLAGLLWLSGCSVSDSELSNAEKRLNELVAQGVPDSALSKPRVLLFQARDAMQRSEKVLARKSADSLKKFLEIAMRNHKEGTSQLTPWLTSQISAIRGAASGVTGLNKKQLDSTAAYFDALVSSGKIYDAEKKLKEFMPVLPQIQADEKRQAEILPQVSGTWECTNITKHSEDKTVRAVERKVFTFKRDKTAYLVEKKSGKSTPVFKEDWEFVSTGTYDVKGDTIKLFINRFKATKQNFWDLKDRDGKKTWVANIIPPYDSLINDHSQDRFITFGDLKEDFVRR
ncbi:MAG: lipocalin family protein [Chitinivibrionales bacterium]|nr:lipocalin family protein [Chitinivibrionales bacterium]